MTNLQANPKHLSRPTNVKQAHLSPNLNLLKLVAMISMVIDHVHLIGFGRPYPALTQMGLIAFPLFAFILSYNYVFYTSNKKKYLQRLLIFALISQLPFQWALGFPFDWFPPPLNIFITLSIGLSIIYLCERISSLRLRNYLLCAICGGALLFEAVTGKAYSFMIDAGFSGAVLIPAVYILYRVNRALGWILIAAALAILDDSLCWVSILTVVTAYYSGYITPELGVMRRHKYFFYWFYPVHLIVIRLLFLWK